MANPMANLTIGVDLGDRYSELYGVDAAGACVETGRIRTTVAGLEQWFGGRPPARVVLEAGTHSPWASRVLPQLVQVHQRERVDRVGVPHDQGVARELHEVQVPQNRATVEGHLPALLCRARGRGEHGGRAQEAEAQRETCLHAGRASAFPPLPS